jgi:hypothetical protein
VRRSGWRSFAAQQRRHLGVIAGLIVGLLTLGSCGSGSTGTVSPSSSPTLSIDTNQAIKAVAAQIRKCATQATTQPINCPQSTSLQLPGEVLTTQWTLFGDPSVGAKVTVAPDGGTATVVGGFEMVGDLTTKGSDVRPYRVFSGGTFEASLTITGNTFDIQSVRMPVNPSFPYLFQHPAGVVDSEAVTAVRKAFDECTHLHVTFEGAVFDFVVPNCPQSAPSPFAANVYQNITWTLVGDPVQGALTHFLVADGSFQVSGAYVMQLDYDVMGTVGTGIGHHTTRSQGSYSSTVVWDGSKFVVITIAAA